MGVGCGVGAAEGFKDGAGDGAKVGAKLSVGGSVGLGERVGDGVQFLGRGDGDGVGFGVGSVGGVWGRGVGASVCAWAAMRSMTVRSRRIARAAVVPGAVPEDGYGASFTLRGRAGALIVCQAAQFALCCDLAPTAAPLWAANTARQARRGLKRFT